MIRNYHTRIVATLGPASRTPAMVLALARAGVNVFRLNFSHGAPAEHQGAFAAVRAAEVEIGRPLAILADLQGPKFRVGDIAGEKMRLAEGQILRFDLDPTPGDRRRAPLLHPEMLRALNTGRELAIDDGKVRLRVTATGQGWAEAEVIAGDTLMSHKGVAAPGLILPVPAMTQKDHQDLAFALRHGADWVALSFVQRAADMAELRQLVGGRASIMAKIEKPSALTDIEAILDVSDGLMVARGDLGVELAPEEVPVAQKTIVRAARRRGAAVIIATQMLESMTGNPTPTRAEASDVANGVYEGADALMLSAESASGAYPLEAVRMMEAIIRRVERDPSWPGLMAAENAGDDDEDVDALIAAAREASKARSTACLVAFTTLGDTARRMARERPMTPVLALTPDPAVARRLCLYWGLEPRVAPKPLGITSMTEEAAQLAADMGLAPLGSRVLIIAGTPFGAPGAANLLRFASAPRPKQV